MPETANLIAFCGHRPWDGADAGAEHGLSDLALDQPGGAAG